MARVSILGTESNVHRMQTNLNGKMEMVIGTDKYLFYDTDTTVEQITV